METHNGVAAHWHKGATATGIRLAASGYRLQSPLTYYCSPPYRTPRTASRFSPPNFSKEGLIRSLINFLLSNKLIVIKLRYLSPLWGDASQSEAGGIYIYAGSNSLGAQANRKWCEPSVRMAKICHFRRPFLVHFLDEQKMNKETLGEQKMNKETIHIAESETSSDFIAIKYHLS